GASSSLNDRRSTDPGVLDHWVSMAQGRTPSLLIARNIGKGNDVQDLTKAPRHVPRARVSQHVGLPVGDAVRALPDDGGGDGTRSIPRELRAPGRDHPRVERPDGSPGTRQSPGPTRRLESNRARLRSRPPDKGRGRDLDPRA